MTKTAFLLALIIAGFASMPAQAQRVFVSGTGADNSPCTVAKPCRTFQKAYDTAPANGEIDVLDPADYGPLTITHGISIQGHGWGGITQAASGPTSAAITVAVTTSDPVSLNGLVLDGAGTGFYGISIKSGPSVQILNSVIRHFQYGIFDNANGSNLLVEDTIASDNAQIGIAVSPSGGTIKATLSRITTNNNQNGILTNAGDTTISNSVISNNSSTGLTVMGVSWLAKTMISGNLTGVLVNSFTVNSYGDNYIRDNATPVSGVLTPVTTQ